MTVRAAPPKYGYDGWLAVAPWQSLPPWPRPAPHWRAVRPPGRPPGTPSPSQSMSRALISYYSNTQQAGRAGGPACRMTAGSCCWTRLYPVRWWSAVAGLEGRNTAIPQGSSPTTFLQAYFTDVFCPKEGFRLERITGLE